MKRNVETPPAKRTNLTDLTDVTYLPTTNAEFLIAIFQGLTEPTRPFVLGFPGNPNDHKAWRGDAWCAEKGKVDNPALNWYFSLAAYKPTDDRYDRRERNCAAIYGVMLDDLGTKALPLSRLDACPPSYVIETSDNNFQAGYLLASPVTEFDRIKSLNQSMVEAGFCDPGAKSPATRYGRLPFASNGKTSPVFKCRLAEWHPERRYSVAEIIKGLKLAPHQAAAKLTRKATVINRVENDGIYIPRPDENEVIAALKNRGLYKQPLGSGRHDITCPWVHEHTGSIDNGTAYFEPDDSYPIGGFKCQHSHGDKYRVSTLLEYLNVTIRAAKHKPTIKVEAGEIHRIVDAGERELAATGRYYQRGALIVSVATDPESRETTIKPVPQPALLRALSGCAIWTRYDARSGAEVVCDPPARHVSVLYDAGEYMHLPALAGIARQPHLRPDGSLVRNPGFDAATGLFGVFDETTYRVSDRPTREQAASALQELRALLSEFAFGNAQDEATALAAMLTAAIRSSLPTAPMIHVKAPQIASGKSYLTELIATFASSTQPSSVAFPTSNEEMQKLLLATLLPAPAAVIFDNLTTDLIPYDSLCSALTAEHLTGRILGLSKTATVGTRAMFLSSGNNVYAVRDMGRRCLTIVLDPQVENPATRHFNSNPLQIVRDDRPHYVSLALTIIRAWIIADGPATTCKPWGNYARWSDWVRQPLLWLGLPDPAASAFEQMEQDPDHEMLGRLLHAWHKTFGSSPTMIREACAKAQSFDAQELNEVLFEVAEIKGEINRRSLGKWISRHQGRIVDGLRFEKASGTTSAERWLAKSVTSVKSVVILDSA